MNLNNSDNQHEAPCCSAFWEHQSKLIHGSQHAMRHDTFYSCLSIFFYSYYFLLFCYFVVTFSIMFCDVHRLSVYLNMLIVTVFEIHSLILYVCMIMQPQVSYADLLLKVFQINLKTVGSSIRFRLE